MRKLLIIIGVLIVLLIVAVVAAANLVDADQFRPTVEKQASEALGRQVLIGKLKLALFEGGVTAEQLSIADDPRYGRDPFLAADSMNIGVNLPELIFHRKLDVESFRIHAPRLNLVEDQKGDWNYSTLGNKSAQPKTTGAAPEIAVKKFTLDDGLVTVHHLGSPKTTEYSKLKLEAKDLSLVSAVPFEFSAKLPHGGSIEAKGDFGPLAQQSDRTPMRVEIRIRDLDIASTGFSDPGSPLRGVIDSDANVNSDGTRTQVDAKITGKQMCLAAGCTPSKMPVKMDVKAGYLLADRIANLSSGVLRLGSSAANVAGTVDLKGTKPRLNARVDSSSLAVNDIESFLPALGIVLPSGARLEGGTASVKATAVGPPDALTIRGHVGLVNSKVTGYDLGSQMATVTKLSGIKVGKETLIQQFASDVQQSAAGTKLDNILLVLPGIGRLTGAGTIGKGNELNFAMKAQVDMSHSPVGQITSVLGRKNMMMGVPFHISGTTQQPKFTPDFAGGVPGVGSAGNLAQAVGGLASKGVPAIPKGVPTIPKGAEGVTKGLGGLGGMFGK